MWESVKNSRILFVFVWIHTEQKYVVGLTSQSGFELSESQTCIRMAHAHCILTSLLGKNCCLSLVAISVCTFLVSPPIEVFVLRHLQLRLPSSRRQALFCRCSRSFISALEASINFSKWKRNIKSYPVSLGVLL